MIWDTAMQNSQVRLLRTLLFHILRNSSESATDVVPEPLQHTYSPGPGTSSSIQSDPSGETNSEAHDCAF